MPNITTNHAITYTNSLLEVGNCAICPVQLQEERNRADPHTKSDVKKTTNENQRTNVASP